MSKLSKDTQQRIVISLTSESAGKELIDAIESGKVLSGSEAPSDSLGENGDLYVNITNGDLYKKYNSSWSLQESGGGGDFANRDLSNLTPTAIPAGVNLESVGSAFSVKTKDQTTATSGEITLKSGEVSSLYSGNVLVSSGSNSNANGATSLSQVTGTLDLWTGDINGGVKGLSGGIRILSGYILSSNFSGYTGSINIETGIIDGTNCNGETGGASLGSGAISHFTSTGNTGVVRVYSGLNNGFGNTGEVSVRSGGKSAMPGSPTGNTGVININSGNNASIGNTGEVSLASGNASQGNSGNINIGTGNNLGTGDSGNINLVTGNTSGTRGSVLLDGRVVSADVDVHFKVTNAGAASEVWLGNTSYGQLGGPYLYAIGIANNRTFEIGGQGVMNLTPGTTELHGAAIISDTDGNYASGKLELRTKVETGTNADNASYSSGDIEIYTGDGTVYGSGFPDANSGNVIIRTGNKEGSGTRGYVSLSGSHINANLAQIKNVADATDPNDAVNLSQLETITNDLEDRVVSLEDNSNVNTVYAYEDNLQVSADGQPGVKDPSSLIRDGWYYKNLVAGQKINWYYFDGLNQGTVTLGDLKSVYAVMTFDAIRAPILAIYTVPTGVGDALPPFAHSRIVYDATMTPTPVIGKKYLVYGGEEPSVHPELPRIQLALVPVQSVGEKLPTEQILTVSFGSDSAASVNSVQYMVETLGLFSDPVKHEMDLRIRVGSQLELDNKANKDLSNLVTTSIPAGVNLESVSSAFTVKTKNQTSAGSGEMLLRSGDVTTTYPSGGVYIASGSNSSANAATSSTTSTGGLYLYTGDLLGTQGSSGHIEMLTGYVLSNNFTGNTGSINVGSGWIQGSNCTGNTGATLVWSGTILNSTSVGDTGVVSVYSGNNAGTGNSGNVSVYTGTVASGARGFVSLDGSYITVNSKQIKDVADGTANNDAVNVSQLNSAIASNFEDIEQPVGLKDPTQVALSIDDSSRTLTVAPTGASFVCFVKGKKITISSSLQSTWPNTPGLHFFYIDQTGSLITTTTFTDAIITEYSFVSMVYWDDVAAKHIIFANEKHGMKMSPITHAYLHRTRGAAFDSGGKLVNFVVDGGGSSDTHAQFTSNLGVIWDEDIRIPYPAQAQIPVFYKSGASGLWKRKEANSFPLIISGEEGYTGASGLIPYNHFNGSSWVLSEASNNKFVLVHIFATNDIEFPVIAIQGQVEYNDKTTARKGALTEIRELSGLPVYEFCPLGSVIFQTSNAYTNTPKAQIVSTADGDNYEDHRLDSIRPGSLA